jgi:sugar phosphate isomerase/epimerase
MKSNILKLFLPTAITLALTIVAPAQKNDANPLGTFSFDFKRLGKDPAEQVQALKKIGFSGATLTFRDNFKAFSKEVKKGDFEIYAAHQAIYIGKKTKLNTQQISRQVDQVKSVDADFWLIILEKNGDKASTDLLVETINKVADICAKKGVKCVLYPHDATLMESAEEAIEILKKTKRKDLYISFHLCHEIRAGNGNRLEAVAKKVKPYLRLASISGADVKYVDNSQDWSKTIQPLDKGTYDTSKFIKALKSIDYKGPVILHTFALHKVKADHHQRSFKKYQELFSK